MTKKKSKAVPAVLAVVSDWNPSVAEQYDTVYALLGCGMTCFRSDEDIAAFAHSTVDIVASLRKEVAAR